MSYTCCVQLFPALLPHWRRVFCRTSKSVCLLSPACPLIRLFFFSYFFSFIYFPPFYVSVEHSACVVDTFVVQSFRSTVVQCFGSVPILEHIASVHLLRQQVIFVGTSPPSCPCCMSVLSSRSCLLTSSSVRTLHPPPSPIRYWSSTNVIACDCYSFLRRPILINTFLSIRHRRFN